MKDINTILNEMLLTSQREQEGDGAIQPAILENGEAYRRAGEGLRI